MKRGIKIASAIVLLITFFPWLGYPWEFVHWNDRLKASVPVALVFGFPCEKDEGETIFRDLSPNCLKFEQPRRFSGIWLDEFENSVFIEGAIEIPPKDSPLEERTWITFPGDFSHEAIVGHDTAYTAEGRKVVPYRIEFIGKKRDAGTFGAGHLSAYDSVIWVDEVVVLEQIGEPYWPGWIEEMIENGEI